MCFSFFPQTWVLVTSQITGAPFVLTDALVTLPVMVLRDGRDRGFQLPGGQGQASEPVFSAQLPGQSGGKSMMTCPQ